MTRPSLALVPPPTPVEPPAKPIGIAPAVAAQAENLKQRSSAILGPLCRASSTDKVVARSKGEIYALATELQKLARRL